MVDEAPPLLFYGEVGFDLVTYFIILSSTSCFSVFDILFVSLLLYGWISKESDFDGLVFFNGDTSTGFLMVFFIYLLN